MRDEATPRGEMQARPNAKELQDGARAGLTRWKGHVLDVTLLLIAGLGAIAFAVSKVVKRFVPEIVVFLALGFAIGPEGPLQLINAANIQSLNLLTQVALGAIIFLIGDRMRLDDLKTLRRVLIPLNVAQILASAALVFLATRWAGADIRVALVLGLIAAETGVLTVSATVREARARGPFTDFLLSSVGLTNVVVAALFGLSFPFILASTGEASSLGETLLVFAQIVVASSVLGLIGGWVLRTVGGAIETSGELLLFLLITLTGLVGGAIAVNGSVVVTTLIAGLYVANAAPWLADRFFAAVRTLEAPIYLIFFVVAGAGIHLEELAAVGAVGGAYVVARAVGKLGGSILGIFVAPEEHRQLGLRTGLSLLPHAGMAIALVAFVVEQSPQLGGEVSAVVLGSIVLFELSGPLFTRRALRAAGETGGAAGPSELTLPDLAAAGTFRRILVPVGNIEVILPRLGFLFDLIGNVGAELVVVHVSEPGSGFDEDREPAVLRLIREVASDRNLACTTVHKVSEHIASAVVRTAREQDVDLVVIGEPMRSSLFEPSHWGLVARRVARDIDVPVLTYPVDTADPSRVPSVYRRRALEARVADATSGNRPTREPVQPRPRGG